LLTQQAIDQFHTENLKVSIVLFDEIEKASDALWQLLLGVLDKATLTLGDNRRVDFSHCIIVMTSNLGATEMSNLANGRFGFSPKTEMLDARYDQKINRAAVEAARKKFTPEFFNRIDKVVVFRTLRPAHLERILELELEQVQQRILSASGPKQFLFACTERAKQFLLKEGTDATYGARHLKRAIEKNLVSPLASLVATAQLKFGDFVRIDLGTDGRFTFTREAERRPSRMAERYESEAEVHSIAAAAAESARSLLG
jgi:ATP-dependent Clp protease ATP-binding subunit ClpA